jgi:hypothetical protein
MRAQRSPLRVCFLSLNEPDEIEVFRSHLDARRFAFTDIGAAAAHLPLGGERGATAEPWLLNACRPDLTCDLVNFSGEFAGRFFDRRGVSLSLQELEQASCDPRCAGLFHRPREVFLLGCNTLASKDADSRTPESYLRVLLDHGFDRAAAEQVVAVRYGPLGPSFRESLRRIFAGVPRIYVRLGRAARPLQRTDARALPAHAARLSHRAGGALGRRAAQPCPPQCLRRHRADPDRRHVGGGERGDAARRDLRPVRRGAIGGRTPARRLRAPPAPGRPGVRPRAVQVFLARHPPAAYGNSERSVPTEIQALDATRSAVLDLVPRLQASALQLELAHFATLVGWLHPAELHALAVGRHATARRAGQRPDGRHPVRHHRA